MSQEDAAFAHVVVLQWIGNTKPIVHIDAINVKIEANLPLLTCRLSCEIDYQTMPFSPRYSAALFSC